MCDVTSGSGGGQNCLRKVESTNSSGHKVCHSCHVLRDCCSSVRRCLQTRSCSRLLRLQVVEWIEVQRQFEVCSSHRIARVYAITSRLQTLFFILGTGRLTVQPLLPSSHSPVARCIRNISRAGSFRPAAGVIIACFLESACRWWPRKCGSVNTGRLFLQHWRVAAHHFSDACSICCYGPRRPLCIWRCSCWLLRPQRWSSQLLLVTGPVLFPAFHRCPSLALFLICSVFLTHFCH